MIVLDAVFDMRRIFLTLLLLFGFPGIGSAATLIVVGDSLSAGYGIDPAHGWVQLLKQRVARQNESIRVINASISGDTSDGAIVRLPELLFKYKPKIVIIELGGNDGLRGLPLKRLRANLEKMILRSRAAGAKVLLIGMRLPPNYGPRYTRLFHQLYQDLSTRYELQLVPFLLAGVGGQPELMQSDGIHPRESAQMRLLDNVWPHLQSLLPNENQ
jgi:acyl-CoA thioesterase-1